MSRVLYYVIWLIVGGFWFYWEARGLATLHEHAAITFEGGSYLVAHHAALALNGFYFGALLLYDRKFSLNVPLLLVVTLPSLLFTLYQISYFLLEFQFPGVNLAILYGYGVDRYIYTIFGLSLFFGLFHERRKTG